MAISWNFLGALCLCAMVRPSGATEAMPPAIPAEIANVIHAAQPYGEARYGFLILTAYHAQLWTDAPRWSMDVPFALTLTYGMHFSTEEMVTRANDEMTRLDPGLSDGERKAYDAKLTEAFPAVKPGDRITALNVPGKPARFFRDGVETAAIDDPRLNADFFGIWLSPNSSQPSQRNKLVRAP